MSISTRGQFTGAYMSHKALGFGIGLKRNWSQVNTRTNTVYISFEALEQNMITFVYENPMVNIFCKMWAFCLARNVLNEK